MRVEAPGNVEWVRGEMEVRCRRASCCREQRRGAQTHLHLAGEGSWYSQYVCAEDAGLKYYQCLNFELAKWRVLFAVRAELACKGWRNRFWHRLNRFAAARLLFAAPI